MLMILIRRKYPRWWFDWNLELARFATRVTAYLMLLRDDYPSTDEPQGVHLDIPYPDVEGELSAVPAPGQVDPGDSALHRPGRRRQPGGGRDRHRLVRDPDRRPLPEGAVPVRGGDAALVLEGRDLRLPAHHRQVPAVPVRRRFLRTGRTRHRRGRVSVRPRRRHRGADTPCDPPYWGRFPRNNRRKHAASWGRDMQRFIFWSAFLTALVMTSQTSAPELGYVA